MFVIPCAARTAVVWCPAGGGAVAEVRFSGRPAMIRARKKLFRPGQSLEALLIDGVQFRDGAACELTLNAPGGVRVAPHRARLARWDHADTRSVLKLIASRFADEIDDTRAFERYLAFISVWQAPGRLVQAFTDGCLVDVHAEASVDRLQVYAITSRGLSAPSVQIVSSGGGRSMLWLHESDIEYLFLDLPDGLVRVDVTSSYAAAPGASPPNEQPALVEALHQAVPNPSHDVAAWAARQCRTRLSVDCGETTMEVLRAVRLPSQETAVFIRANGGEEVHSLRVAAFGDTDGPSTEIVTRDAPRPVGEWQQQMIVRLPASPEGAGCCRLSWRCGEHESVAWIRETDLGEPDHAALAREFAALASVDPTLFSEVLYPLAAAPTRETSPRLVQVMETGSDTAASADVFIFTGRDLEAVHRTLIGLSLTTPAEPVRVHICLFDPSLVEAAAAAVQAWRRLYRVSLCLRCYTAQTTEAQVILQALSAPRPQIFCRAGAIPQRSDWLTTLLTRFNADPMPLLLGASPLAAERAPDSPSGIAGHLAAGLSPDLSDFVAAAAVGPGCRSAALDLQVLTLEGFMLAQALHRPGAPAGAEFAPELSFVQSSAPVAPGEFDRCVDSHSLQKLAKSLSATRRQVKVVRGRPSRESGSPSSQPSPGLVESGR